MTGIPGEDNPGSGDVGGQEQVRQPLQEELKASLEWLAQAAQATGDLSRLALLELRLAVGDSGRLVILSLVMIPVFLLAWTGLSVLLAWSAFAWLGSVALAIGVFTGLQVVILGVLLMYWRKYARSLSLPVTSKRLQAIREQAHGAQKTTATDTSA